MFEIIISVNIVNVSSLMILLLTLSILSTWETSLTTLKVLRTSSWESLSLLTVDLRSNWVVNILEFLSLLVILVLGSISIGMQPLLELFTFRVDLLFLLFRNLVFDSLVFDHRLDLIDVLLEVVLGFNLLLSLLIGLSVFLSLLDESINFLLRKSSFLVRNGDVRSLTSSLVLSSNSENTIGIKIERNFNLRNSSWSRSDTIEVELTQQMVISSHWSFSFENLNLDTWLVISIGGENLSLLNRNGSVSLDEFSHDTSSSLNTQRQWSNIQKQQLIKVLSFILVENSSLNSCSVSNGFVRIDGFV